MTSTASTALMLSFFEKRGSRADYYIPDRSEEGYGVNLTALERIRESGTTLVITVDSGITAVEEALYA
jgi:single-stranded-DNA-specific exonuclease